MKKRSLLIGLAIVIVMIGFIRDALFIPINEVIEKGGDSDGKLGILKWVLTALFTIVYMGLTAGSIFLVFRSLKYSLLSIGIYAALCIFSFLIALIGYIFFTFSDVYPLVRTIMGIVQSPVILIVLIASCYLNEKLRVDK
jgi:hypothetical protein